MLQANEKLVTHRFCNWIDYCHCVFDQREKKNTRRKEMNMLIVNSNASERILFKLATQTRRHRNTQFELDAFWHQKHCANVMRAMAHYRLQFHRIKFKWNWKRTNCWRGPVPLRYICEYFTKSLHLCLMKWTLNNVSTFCANSLQTYDTRDTSARNVYRMSHSTTHKNQNIRNRIGPAAPPCAHAQTPNSV